MCLHWGQCRIPPRFTIQLMPAVMRCMSPTAQFCPVRVIPGMVHVSQSRHPPAMTAPLCR
jgi:hypothetical protein